MATVVPNTSVCRDGASALLPVCGWKVIAS